MGGGSSNDQKAQQVNQQAMRQLLIEKDNKDKNQQLRQSKLNSPRNSPINSPRNNQSFQASKQNIKNQIDSARQSMNNSSLSKGKHQNKDKMDQSKFRSDRADASKQRLGHIYQYATGNYDLQVQTLKLSPDKQFPYFDFLSQKQSSYKAELKWTFDKKYKNWKYSLSEPQSKGLSFMVGEDGQVIQGDANIWRVFNPSFSNQFRTPIDSFYQQIEYAQFKLDQNSYFSPQLQDLQQNRKSLCQAWGQQYNQRFAQFKNKRMKVHRPESQQESRQYRQTRKYFQKQSDIWVLTVFIQESNHQFNSFVIWKSQPQDQEDSFQTLLEKQRKLITLKKEIFVHNMNVQRK